MCLVSVLLFLPCTPHMF
uniref:(California timema) hypothetical protein n=1 Tax=Timema californicum TaxID=61474 RepID=A0A7R9PFP8_TIMCA|nr:unnamed protein product [Timema californicum]